MQTWQMLTRCTETIVRLRRAQAQERGASASDALEEFRRFLGEVVGEGEQRAQRAPG
jgi:hypothetical protein